MLKNTLLCLALLVPSGEAAFAAEGSIFGGPIGGTDIRNAYLPPQPGVYLGLADVGAYGGTITGNNGGPSRDARKLNFWTNIDAVGALYVYPFRLLGGNVASGVQLGYSDYLRFSVNNETQDVNGWTDLHVDFFKWTQNFITLKAPRPGAAVLPYGLVTQIAYSMIFPLGAYSAQHFTSPGHNDYFIIPNIAVTYLARPNFLGDGVEFSGRIFYDKATTNPATHYATGDVMDLDYAVTERTGRFQWGLAGYAASQLTDDRISGKVAAVNGDRLVDIAIGPDLAVDFPKLGFFVNAKIEETVYARNTIFGTLGVLSVGLKL